MAGSLAAPVLSGLADLWLIYAFALLKGIADSFYYPAYAAILPRIAPVRLLRQSNAVVHTTAELSGFFGPALAGALIKQSLEWVFVASGILIAIFCVVAGLRREVREMRIAENSDSQ